MATQSSPDYNILLDKLATDDAFREYMLGDPVAALASIGITIDPAQVPAVRSLPSKASLVADKSALQSKLDNTANMIFFLVSGKI